MIDKAQAKRLIAQVSSSDPSKVLEYGLTLDELVAFGNACAAQERESPKRGADGAPVAVSDSGVRYYHPEEMYYRAEEWECAMLAMDDIGVPRADAVGDRYSLFGRACRMRDPLLSVAKKLAAHIESKQRINQHNPYSARELYEELFAEYDVAVREME